MVASSAGVVHVLMSVKIIRKLHYIGSSVFAEVVNQELKNTTCPAASGGFEGVGGRVVKACHSEDGQSPHGGDDDEDPEEHAVHHHGHVLPVLLQLEEEGSVKKRKMNE